MNYLLYSLATIIVMAVLIALWNLAVKRWGEETVCMVRNAVMLLVIGAVFLLGIFGAFRASDMGLIPEPSHQLLDKPGTR